MEQQIRQQFPNIPTADSTDNNNIADVVGNKTDAAVGAATTDKTLMGYIKGILTDTAVIGDTGSGLTSLSTQASVDTIDGIVDTILLTTPQIVERTTSNLPQATQSALFTITGDVIITRIVGKVTTQIQAQETVVKLVANPTGLADVDVCAALDINGDAVGTKLNVTGTFANAMIASTNGVFELQPNAFELSAGTLDLDTDNDSSTGQIQWTIHYIKGSSDGAVVVA